MKLNYYARLKEDNVCIEIISTPKNLNGVKGYVSIPDYNETLLYRKWHERLGWSEERYEPSVDSVIQDRLEGLETQNILLQSSINDLNQTNTLLSGSVVELTMIIQSMLS